MNDPVICKRKNRDAARHSNIGYPWPAPVPHWSRYRYPEFILDCRQFADTARVLTVSFARMCSFRNPSPHFACN